MTLIEHLGELRTRIIKVAAAFFVAAIVAWFFVPQIFDLLLYKNVPFDWPLKPDKPFIEGRLNVTAVTEQLMTDLKMALYVAFVLTIPILLYQAWAFVAPAVGDMGRAFTYTLITLASSLFLAGVAFSYLILPVGLNFLLNWGPDRYNTIITAQFYLPFITRTLLAFGIVFELPAATYVAAKLGLVDAPLLKRYRKHAIIANVILAAALTPGQDVYTMVLLAVPMLFMYELSIIVARYVNPTTEVAAHELARVGDQDETATDQRQDERDHEQQDTSENGESGEEERDL